MNLFNTLYHNICYVIYKDYHRANDYFKNVNMRDKYDSYNSSRVKINSILTEYRNIAVEYI